MQDITVEELLTRYIAGERDFSYVILQYVTFNEIELKGVNFTGAIFNHINFKVNFINCNFSCSEWWFCYLPWRLIGCNLQYGVMEGCYFRGKFIDCDWRYGQRIGGSFDEFIFELCDLSKGRWSEGSGLEPEMYIRPSWSLLYKDSFDKEGVFRSGIHCSLPEPGDNIPF